MEGAVVRTDTLEVDDLLSEEEHEIGVTVRDYARTEVAPHIADWYERGTIPVEIARDLGKLGVLGMHLKGYGCQDVWRVEQLLAADFADQARRYRQGAVSAQSPPKDGGLSGSSAVHGGQLCPTRLLYCLVRAV